MTVLARVRVGAGLAILADRRGHLGLRAARGLVKELVELRTQARRVATAASERDDQHDDDADDPATAAEGETASARHAAAAPVVDLRGIELRVVIESHVV